MRILNLTRWDDVKEKLEEVRSLLQTSTKTERNIPLLPSSKDSNKRKSNIKCNLLTLRKKIKTDKSRVGVAKEKKHSASAIDVLMPPDTKTIIEEVPDLILDENFNESASDELDNNLSSSTELKLNLSHEEIDRIINQRLFNDTVIHYFQKLVKHVNDLPNPLLRQNLNFKGFSEEFIQLLHDERHHWVTISTLDCRHGEIKYYDSMFKSKLTESVKNQICLITRFKRKNIKIDVLPFYNNKMGLIVAFMLLHSWYPSSTRKILQAYLLIKKSCEIIYMIATNKKG